MRKLCLLLCNIPSKKYCNIMLLKALAVLVAIVLGAVAGAVLGVGLFWGLVFLPAWGVLLCVCVCMLVALVVYDQRHK